MELLVAILAILGLVAIAARFGLRGSPGSVRLPRIVDDSVGMWVLRRLTGRPLLGRAAGDRPDPLARFRRPSTVLAARVPPPRRRPIRPAGPSSPAAARHGAGASVTAPPTASAPASARDAASDVGSSGSWQVIPRRPATRTFGSSIQGPAGPAQPSRPGRTTAMLGYLGLGLTVAVVAFVAGAALGSVSTRGVPPGTISPTTERSGVSGSPSATTRLSARPEPLASTRVP